MDLFKDALKEITKIPSLIILVVLDVLLFLFAADGQIFNFYTFSSKGLTVIRFSAYTVLGFLVAIISIGIHYYFWGRFKENPSSTPNNKKTKVETNTDPELLKAVEKFTEWHRGWDSTDSFLAWTANAASHQVIEDKGILFWKKLAREITKSKGIRIIIQRYQQSDYEMLKEKAEKDNQNIVRDLPSLVESETLLSEPTSRVEGN